MSGEANQYLAELRAERDRLREVVRRVEGLAEALDAEAKRHDDAEPVSTDGLTRMILAARSCRTHAREIRTALGSTDTGPAPAGAYEATQGAGGGV